MLKKLVEFREEMFVHDVLGIQVAHSTSWFSGYMCFRVAESLGQAKISNLSPKTCCQQDVATLHISVDQCWCTRGMEILQTCDQSKYWCLKCMQGEI
jgi:hypothetical protein